MTINQHQAEEYNKKDTYWKIFYNESYTIFYCNLLKPEFEIL